MTSQRLAQPGAPPQQPVVDLAAAAGREERQAVRFENQIVDPLHVTAQRLTRWNAIGDIPHIDDAVAAGGDQDPPIAGKDNALDGVAVVAQGQGQLGGVLLGHLGRHVALQIPHLHHANGMVDAARVDSGCQVSSVGAKGQALHRASFALQRLRLTQRPLMQGDDPVCAAYSDGLTVRAERYAPGRLAALHHGRVGQPQAVHRPQQHFVAADRGCLRAVRTEGQAVHLAVVSLGGLVRGRRRRRLGRPECACLRLAICRGSGLVLHSPRSGQIPQRDAAALVGNGQQRPIGGHGHIDDGAVAGRQRRDCQLGGLKAVPQPDLAGIVACRQQAPVRANGQRLDGLVAGSQHLLKLRVVVQHGQQSGVDLAAGLAGDAQRLDAEQEGQVRLRELHVARLRGHGARPVLPARAVGIEDQFAGREQGQNQEDGCQRADARQPPPHPLPALCLLAGRQKLAIQRAECVGMAACPLLGLDQIALRQQHTGDGWLALLLPTQRAALQWTQLLLAPDGVVLLHWPHQTVVGQLEPGGAAALLGPQQVRVHQPPDGRVGQPLAGIDPLQHLAAHVLAANQGAFDPIAQRALADARAAGHGRGCVSVVAAQRRVHIADRLDVVHADAGIVRRQPVPQPPTDHLELDWLHAVARHGDGRAIGLLHPHSAQIVYQARCGRIGEIYAGQLRRPLHRLDRRFWAEQLQPVAPALVEAGWDRLEIGIETGDEFLAHREDCPAVAVAQGFTDLLEEGQLALPVGRVEGEHLLELVEDEDVAIPGCVTGHRRRSAARQVLVQRQRSQLIRRQLFLGRQPLLQRQQTAQAVTASGAPCAAGQRRADAHRRQHAKSLLLQGRDQPCLQQRRLARA